MHETNRMLGDIGVMYNKSACFGNFLNELYTEVIRRCGDPVIRENLVDSSGVFMTYIALGRERIRRHGNTRKCLKSILKNYLVTDRKKKKHIDDMLSQAEWVHCVFLVITCLENKVLTTNKQKKFFDQLVNAYTH